jgi:hypothetical protein
VRTLTQRELNRALLHRQLLLERARTPIPRTVERMGGLQAQYAPAMYIGLWSRLDGLERDQVTRALERRSVVQATLMRTTIHLVSRRDYWPLEVAVREGRRGSWARTHPAYDPGEWEAAARRLRERLGEVGAPSGTWERRRAGVYAAAEDWIGPPPEGLVREDGIELLIRRYLAAFGPSTRAEIAGFAGLQVGDIAGVLNRMTFRRFRAEDGAELLDLPRAPLPDADTAAPVRFLPVWDATLLVHARRAQILHEEDRPRIFSSKRPQSYNTFLVDGVVAGTWRHEDDRIELDPFKSLPRAVTRELLDEAERLAAFHR